MGPPPSISSSYYRSSTPSFPMLSTLTSWLNGSTGIVTAEDPPHFTSTHDPPGPLLFLNESTSEHKVRPVRYKQKPLAPLVTDTDDSTYKDLLPANPFAEDGWQMVPDGTAITSTKEGAAKLNAYVTHADMLQKTITSLEDSYKRAQSSDPDSAKTTRLIESAFTCRQYRARIPQLVIETLTPLRATNKSKDTADDEIVPDEMATNLTRLAEECTQGAQ